MPTRKLSERLGKGFDAGDDKFDPENPVGVPVHDMGDLSEQAEYEVKRVKTVRERLLHQTFPMNKTLQDFWFLQAEWSRDTFGSDQERGPAGPLEHLAKEIEELRADPTDIMEYVDCIFLIIDAARRQGYSFYDVMDGLFLKLKQNVMRKWQKPTTDRAVEHVRKKLRRSK